MYGPIARLGRHARSCFLNFLIALLADEIALRLFREADPRLPTDDRPLAMVAGFPPPVESRSGMWPPHQPPNSVFPPTLQL